MRSDQRVGGTLVQFGGFRLGSCVVLSVPGFVLRPSPQTGLSTAVLAHLGQSQCETDQTLFGALLGPSRTQLDPAGPSVEART